MKVGSIIRVVNCATLGIVNVPDNKLGKVISIDDKTELFKFNFINNKFNRPNRYWLGTQSWIELGDIELLAE